MQKPDEMDRMSFMIPVISLDWKLPEIALMNKLGFLLKKLGLPAKSVESSPQNMEKQSTAGSSLHSDLITEILLRLPAKSVGRFRCVSKLWLSITTDPCFIKSFGTTRPSILLCSIQRHDMFVTQQSTIRSYSSSQPFHLYPMKVPGEHSYFSRMDSVQGLICIVDVDSLKPLVWNPTMGQLLVLPKPKLSSRHMNVFLGYDPVEGKHKVLCLPQRKTCYVCRVFTLGSGQESWRTIKTKFELSVAFASGRCIKGMIYYLAFKSQGFDTVVMSFDVRSEIFHMIEVPSSIHGDLLITYEGRLSCIDGNNDKRLWSLEDATDKHKWSFQDFRSPLYKMYELQGSTHAGEFIYVPSLKSSYIELYDPVGNSWRRHEFEGLISDDEFGHTKAFTNHIESLMPL